MKYFLGVDIGGTKIAAGIVDENGVAIKQQRIPTPAAEGGGAVLRASIDLSQSLLSGFESKIEGIGIGAGGQVDPNRGVIVSATELLPGWAGQPVVDRFVAAFGAPTYVDNDVNALAIGEHRFGSAKSRAIAFVIAIGTGVGGALIIDGKIHHGSHWSGGEVGQIIIDISDNARVDAAGNKGTLEAYVSGHGLVKTWQEITGDRSEIDGEQIAGEALIDSGGPSALAVTQTGRYLGFGLVTIVSLIDPDIIVIGGGLSNIGELLLAPARAVLSTRALPGPSSCPVIAASLGANCSLIGAASVAMEAMQ